MVPISWLGSSILYRDLKIERFKGTWEAPLKAQRTPKRDQFFFAVSNKVKMLHTTTPQPPPSFTLLVSREKRERLAVSIAFVYGKANTIGTDRPSNGNGSAAVAQRCYREPHSGLSFAYATEKTHSCLFDSELLLNISSPTNKQTTTKKR